MSNRNRAGMPGVCPLGRVVSTYTASPMTDLPDSRARDLLLLSGLILLGLIVMSMALRGVDPVEVVATGAFAPIFAAILFFGIRGGVAVAAAASLGYVALRWPAIRLVGIPTLSGLLVSRIVGFLSFGAIGGWAASVVGNSLTKLALFDEIDDATGLHNARSLLAVLDRERSRAGRYAGVFSVVHASFERPTGRGRAVQSALRALGSRLVSSVRISDHLSHFSDDRSHLVVVLPETGAEGAETVRAGLTAALEGWGAVGLVAEVICMPGADEPLSELERIARWSMSSPARD